MKNIRLFSAALVGVGLLAGTASPGQAQQGLELGFRAGYTVASASVDVDQTFDKSNRTGIAGGVFLNYDAGMLGFQVGAQYTKKGVDLEINNVVNEFDLGYIEFPAVLKLGIPLGMVKPSVFGGAGLGFNVTCDVSGQDCSDGIKSSEWMGIAGADLAIYLGGLSLWADGRYHVGLNDIADASDVVGDLKNRSWTLQAGIAFNVGG